MTQYEVISLIISIVAILIPIGQFIFRKVFKQPKIRFYSNGKATLYFNHSGSYLRVDGVIEAINQQISVKKIDVSVTRKRDEKKLNLSWSYFISPVTQNFSGAYSQTTEKAHPFRIEADSMNCAFTEFSDEYNSSWKRMTSYTKDLFESILQIKSANQNYEDALIVYKNSELYKEAKQNISNEFFWEIGKYNLTITILYLNKKSTFTYQFEVNVNDGQALLQNIDESLIAPLKDSYRDSYPIKCYFANAEVELRDEQEG